MNVQSQIRRTLSRPESIARVRKHLADSPEIHRNELASRLCVDFNFVDAQGHPQRSGCVKALRALETRGHFSLPSRRTHPHRPTPRRQESSVLIPQGVPASVGQIRGLELALVDSEDKMRVWNQMFHDEHPQGDGPLVGRQLRYLIGSEHGWLGGLGFASAALHLESRDQWIGWNRDRRLAHLHRIVGMSRFLIRPSVHCKNLASHVLSLATRRLPLDFEKRYGYGVWLIETFADTSQYSGTCYRAANWIRVGTTSGRGRQDHAMERAKSVKDVYLWVLVADFRERCGLAAHAGLGPLGVGAGLERGTWVESEFGGAPLGDKRLSKRLVNSAAALAECPTGSFRMAAKGVPAVIKGYYRFIEQPDASEVTMANILLPHREQTIRRMQAEKTVLCIQDGTDLNYNGATECTGLGVVGTNQTDAKTFGLHLHSTKVVSDHGLPLGILKAQCEAPKSKDKTDKRKTWEIPIEEKETYAWILGMLDCEEIAGQMPQTRVLQVMDREADFFELFDTWRRGTQRTHLIVRANHNRGTTNELNLFEGVRATEPKLDYELHLSRQSARAKKSGQQAKLGRKERVAQVTLRYQRVELCAPRYMRDKAPIPVWVIHLVEENPPDGAVPVEWYLLSTIDISAPETATYVLKCYSLRWRIEDYHRVLKSGCAIEGLRNETADNLKRAIAIYMVIAWRTMLMTLLGREVPDLPAEVLFSELELEVLTAYVKTRRDLKQPTNLGEVVRVIGRLGGHQGRKNDLPPGHQAIWNGFSTLTSMCAGYLLARESQGP